MVVIAGMVGAGGLGGQVVQSLSRIDIGLGVEAGLSVVILAMILDRVTSGFSTPRPRTAARPARRERTQDATTDAAAPGDPTAEALPAAPRPRHPSPTTRASARPEPARVVTRPERT